MGGLTAGSQQSTNYNPRKVLLIEDDDNLAKVYLLRLQAEGFEAKRGANGERALITAIQYRPELILLDIMLPKISGFDVLDILRNTPETAKAKIIIFSARGQERDRQRAQALGADGYLVKSQATLSEVMTVIKQQLA